MIQERDAEFSEYVAAHWRRLVRSAVLLGCTVPEAEDLVQTTLERCYVKWTQVRRADHPEAYVARMMVNCHRQSRRRRWWGERPTGALPDQPRDDETAVVDAADAVRRGLAGLTRDQREAIVLRYYVGLSEQQIAEAAGVAPGTVKSRLSRGLAALAQNTDLQEGRA